VNTLDKWNDENPTTLKATVYDHIKII